MNRCQWCKNIPEQIMVCPIKGSMDLLELCNDCYKEWWWSRTEIQLGDKIFKPKPLCVECGSNDLIQLGTKDRLLLLELARTDLTDEQLDELTFDNYEWQTVGIIHKVREHLKENP